MTDFSEDILASFADSMRATPQQAQWHEEGDVMTHTRMVCEALCSLPEYTDLSPDKQALLLSAARLHDIGKILTTRQTADRIESPHHASVGSRMARENLWQSGLCGSSESIRARESICRLIQYHSIPAHAIDNDDAALRLHRIAANSLLIPGLSIQMLCTIAKADMLGRICRDKEQLLDQIALCEELAKEEGCLDGCFDFPTKHTMHAYLSGRDVWKDQHLYDDTWGTVYMMSGLPGTGKDTWIRQNLPDIPMVSLDQIRSARKISPSANQGFVANLAKDQAKEYLRSHQSFVWNATNLTRTMRNQLIGLFEDYKARVHIIYLETDLHKLIERNSSREAAVPLPVIKSMLGKLELPEAYEATNVDWICV